MHPKYEMRLEALRLANGVADAHPDKVVERAKVYEQFLAGDFADLQREPVAAKIEHQTEVLPQTTTHMSASVEQPKPVEQPAAPTAKTATADECNKAFLEHTKKGGGRNAMTARTAVVAAIPHFNNFRALSPEECGKAVEALEAA